MNPRRFSFGDAHPGLGVPEKFPGFGVSFFLSRSCREAASFNPAVKRTLRNRPRLALTSFWAKRVLPLRAAYCKR